MAKCDEEERDKRAKGFWGRTCARLQKRVKDLETLRVWAIGAIPEIECRGDEDCDHCHGLGILHELKQEPIFEYCNYCQTETATKEIPGGDCKECGFSKVTPTPKHGKIGIGGIFNTWFGLEHLKVDDFNHYIQKESQNIIERAYDNPEKFKPEEFEIQITIQVNKRLSS